MLERQKCHTDSISPSLHSTNCDRAPSLCFGIGSVWVVGVSSPSLSEEQELCKAVLSGNWSILSAQEVHLQMIRDGTCSRAFFLCLQQKSCVQESCVCLTSSNRVQTERGEAKHDKDYMEAPLGQQQTEASGGNQG